MPFSSFLHKCVVPNESESYTLVGSAVDRASVCRACQYTAADGQVYQPIWRNNTSAAYYRPSANVAPTNYRYCTLPVGALSPEAAMTGNMQITSNTSTFTVPFFCPPNSWTTTRLPVSHQKVQTMLLALPLPPVNELLCP